MYIQISITQLDRGWRRVGNVAIHSAIAVIHGADKDLLLALLAFSSAAALLSISISVFLEEANLARWFGLLLARLILRTLLGRLSVRLRSRFIAFSSTTPSAMSLILSLCGLNLRNLRLRLGQVLLCCHACTSWCVTDLWQRTPAKALPPCLGQAMPASHKLASRRRMVVSVVISGVNQPAERTDFSDRNRDETPFETLSETANTGDSTAVQGLQLHSCRGG
ncbi:MAG: hypothetical protein JOZ83_16105 [Silvibacterium sp.]|nr:hypothetical protein [Silvibacterium sp.]